MCTEGVPEGVTGDPFRPPKPFLMFMDMPGEIIGIDRFVRDTFLGAWKKPFCRSAALKPILCEQVQGIPGQRGIAVLPGFGMGDMDAHVFSVNILIAQAAHFPDTQAGGIHECAHGPGLDAGHGGNELESFLLGRDIREIGVKLPQGKLCGIPWFVKNIDGKKAELRNTVINGSVRKILFFLQPADKTTQFRPGNIFRHLVQDIGKIVQIRADISRIRYDGMVRKTA